MANLLGTSESGCNQWLDDFLLPFCGLQAVCPLWPLTQEGQHISLHTAVAHWRFSLYGSWFSVNHSAGCDVVKTPADQQRRVKRSDNHDDHVHVSMSPRYTCHHPRHPYSGKKKKKTKTKIQSIIMTRLSACIDHMLVRQDWQWAAELKQMCESHEWALGLLLRFGWAPCDSTSL